MSSGLILYNRFRGILFTKRDARFLTRGDASLNGLINVLIVVSTEPRNRPRKPVRSRNRFNCSRSVADSSPLTSFSKYATGINALTEGNHLLVVQPRSSLAILQANRRLRSVSSQDCLTSRTSAAQLVGSFEKLEFPLCIVMSVRVTKTKFSPSLRSSGS